MQVKQQFAGLAAGNVRVLNNSWGGSGFSQALQDEIDRAGANDILFVAAAGNSSANLDAAPDYPAATARPNMLTVASSNMYDQLSAFSNYSQTLVHLVAPGETILSTLPGAQYGYMSGTSMATPMVSGAAALVYEVAWTRLLTLQLGHTVAAASTVLAAFMGGLAIGAWIAGQWNGLKAVPYEPPQATPRTPPDPSLVGHGLPPSPRASADHRSLGEGGQLGRHAMRNYRPQPDPLGVRVLLRKR